MELASPRSDGQIGQRMPGKIGREPRLPTQIGPVRPSGGDGAPHRPDLRPCLEWRHHLFRPLQHAFDPIYIPSERERPSLEDAEPRTRL